MQVEMIALLLLNAVAIGLLIYEIRRRERVERELEELQSEHYKLRKETGRLTPQERMFEAASGLTDALVRGFTGRAPSEPK